MNDMLKNIKTNSYKAKAEVIPKSPEQTLKLKEKKSLTITSVATTPKPQTATNKLLTQNSYSTNSMTEAKFRLTPKGNPTQKISEKRVDKFKTCQIPTTTGPLIKKSLSQSKETKPSISIPAQNSPKKTKVTLQLTDEDKNLINSIDVMKTPKKPMMGNFSTPKACSSAVTNRYAFSPEADHSKVLNILNPNNNISISTNNLKLYTNQNYQNAKFSSKSMSYVKAYSANTNQGIIRNYNEDRVSIILNIVRPSTYTQSYWPKCSFFAVYDGHGGCLCADYLRDNLHNFIIKSSKFPANVKEAIVEGFEIAEKEFINNYSLNKLKTELVDKSGSCALIALIVDDVCYMANVGDSRAVISRNGGKEWAPLTVDHKPNEESESKRIVENGGKVYQTQAVAKNFNLGFHHNQLLIGPYRVLPGRLSVSRTFGDAEAKLSQFGGNEKVIIAVPDIVSFKIDHEVDFIAMGCDGIFDQLNDQEVVQCVWLSFEESVRGKNIHLQCGVAVDLVLKSSLLRKTLDNVTCVLIAFENFEKCFMSNTNNFNFNTINSNLSTYNTLNTPIHNNRNFSFESKDDKGSTIAKSQLPQPSNYSTENLIRGSDEILQLSISTDCKSDCSSKKDISFVKESSQESLNESPLRIRSSKTGLNLIPAGELNLNKYLTRGKNEKTIDINLASYVTNTQKQKSTPTKKINMSEEVVRAIDLNKPNPKNLKKAETPLKYSSKK